MAGATVQPSDVQTRQRPEVWPPVVVWVSATYEKVLFSDDPKIDTVEVFYGNTCLVKLPVVTADERSRSAHGP